MQGNRAQYQIKARSYGRTVISLNLWDHSSHCNRRSVDNDQDKAGSTCGQHFSRAHNVRYTYCVPLVELRMDMWDFTMQHNARSLSRTQAIHG